MAKFSFGSSMGEQLKVLGLVSEREQKAHEHKIQKNVEQEEMLRLSQIRGQGTAEGISQYYSANIPQNSIADSVNWGRDWFDELVRCGHGEKLRLANLSRPKIGMGFEDKLIDGLEAQLGFSIPGELGDFLREFGLVSLGLQETLSPMAMLEHRIDLQQILGGFSEPPEELQTFVGIVEVLPISTFGGNYDFMVWGRDETDECRIYSVYHDEGVLYGQSIGMADWIAVKLDNLIGRFVGG